MNYGGDYNILTKASYSGTVIDPATGYPVAQTDPHDPAHGGDGIYGSITLTGSNASLKINGNTYTLIQSMSQLDALDNYNAATGTYLNGVTSPSTVTGYYAIAQNLDASGTTYNGPLINTLTGTLAGLGHTVSNLTITSSNADVGLIGTLGSSSTVGQSMARDIGIVNAAITGSGYVGSLAAVSYGNVKQAYSTGSVVSQSSYAGGLIYYVDGTSSQHLTVTDCYSEANVYGFGGLFGRALYTNVYDSHASGQYVRSYSGYAGGLIGYTTGVSVYNSYATDAVVGAVDASGAPIAANLGYATYLGGLIGYVIEGGPTNYYVANSYATGNVSGYTFLGGLIGNISLTYGTGNYVITNSYATGNVTGKMTQATGDWTSTSSGIGGLVGCYTGAFSSSGSDSTTLIINNSHATGNVTFTDYYGSGAGGLIGSTIYGAVITNSYATGNVSSANGGTVGGFIGGDGAMTTINDCYATGNVSGTRSVGGFVGADGGLQFGSVIYISTITNSYATGNVTSTAGALAGVGGFVGTNGYPAVISNSYATGDVYGMSGSSAGGFVGMNVGTINNSYATGTVHDSNGYAGGFAGVNYNGSGNANSTNSGILNNVYYNADANPGLGSTSGYTPANQNTGTVNGGGGLTTGQMPDVQYYLNGTINQVLAARAAEAAYAAQQEANFETDGQQTGGQASFSGQGSNSSGEELNNQVGSFTPSNTGTVNGTMDNHIVYSSDSGSYSATIKSITADGVQFDLEGGSQGGGGGAGGTNK